jgi:hypothetical protein
MAYDNNLILEGSSTNDVVDISTNGNGTQMPEVGANRVFHADLRVAGTVGGTTPSLTYAIQESTTAAGTAWTTVGTFPAVTASMVLTTNVNTGPVSITFRTTKKFIRRTATVSATATFGSVSCRLRPTGEPAIP